MPIPSNDDFKAKLANGDYDTLSESALQALVDGNDLSDQQKSDVERYQTLTDENSIVPIVQLDRFVGELQKADVGFPLFTVTDCNTFHTSGYIWGAYALRRLAEVRGDDRGAVAIVNLDQHADSGGYKASYVKSSAWGGSIQKAIQKLGHDAVYMTIYNGAKKTARWPGIGELWVNGRKVANARRPFGPRADSEADQTFWGCTNSGDFRGIWEVVNAGLEDGRKIKYLFVAIDRDGLQVSYTQWGEGLIENSDLITRVQGVVAGLRAAARDEEIYVIGVDICGLPEHRELLTKCADKTKEAEDVFDMVDDELRDLWDWVNTEKTITKPTGQARVYKANINTLSSENKWARAIFYAGSISYHDEEDWSIHKTFHAPQFIEHTYKYIPLFRDQDPPRWQYVVSHRKPVTFVAGSRPFYLYRHKSYPVDESDKFAPVGDPVSLGSFSSTTSRLKGGGTASLVDMLAETGVFDASSTTCRCGLCRKRTVPTKPWPGVKMQTGGVTKKDRPGPPEVY